MMEESPFGIAILEMAFSLYVARAASVIKIEAVSIGTWFRRKERGKVND